MHDFWLRHGKTLRYNAIKLRILTLKQGEKKLRIFAEMNLKVLFIGWIKLLPGPLRTACAHAGAFCFIKRKSPKLLGSSRSFKLCCAYKKREGRTLPALLTRQQQPKRFIPTLKPSSSRFRPGLQNALAIRKKPCYNAAVIESEIFRAGCDSLPVVQPTSRKA